MHVGVYGAMPSPATLVTRRIARITYAFRRAQLERAKEAGEQPLEHRRQLGAPRKGPRRTAGDDALLVVSSRSMAVAAQVWTTIFGCEEGGDGHDDRHDVRRQLGTEDGHNLSASARISGGGAAARGRRLQPGSTVAL